MLHLSTFVHLVAHIAIIIMTDADKRFKTLRFLMWLLERPRVDLDTEESLMIIVLKIKLMLIIQVMERNGWMLK